MPMNIIVMMIACMAVLKTRHKSKCIKTNIYTHGGNTEKEKSDIQERPKILW